MKDTVFSLMTKNQADKHLETTTDFINLGGVYSKNATKREIEKLNKLLLRQNTWKSRHNLKENNEILAHLYSRLGNPRLSFFNAYDNEIFVWGFFYEKNPLILTYSYQEKEPRLDIQLDPECNILMAVEIVSKFLLNLEN